MNNSTPSIRRLGFVGVGKHAQRLASELRACGAAIVGHARQSAVDAPGFGRRVDWLRMLDPNDSAVGELDAVVAVASPEVTTEVATACARAAKPCLATKPLLLTGAPTGTSAASLKQLLYVDLWRLYSPVWSAFKLGCQESRLVSVKATFVGNGPFRSFSGALDYGPHALAFVLDMFGEFRVEEAWRGSRDGKGEVCTLRCVAGGVPIEIVFGNGARQTEKLVQCETAAGKLTFVETEDHQYLSGDACLLSCNRAEALRRFCVAFLDGAPSRTFEVSVLAQQLLNDLSQSAVQVDPGHPA